MARFTFKPETMQYLLRYLMDEDLLKQRLTGQQDYLKGQQNIMRESASLGEQAERNKAMDKWVHEVSTLPPIDSLMSQIQRGKMEGTDTAALEEQLGGIIQKVAKSQYELVTGRPTEEGMADILNLSDATRRELLGEAGASFRQAQKLPLDTRAQETREGALRLGQEELGQRKAEYGLNVEEHKLKVREFGQKIAKQSVDGQEKMVRDAMSYLQAQGVTPAPSAGGEDASKTMKALRDFFSSGKQLSPLSQKDQGKALTYLAQLQYKLTNGKPLDGGEALFVSRVYDSYEIEEKGLPSQITGMREGEGEAGSENMMLNNLADIYVKMGGIDRETALRYARELLGKK